MANEIKTQLAVEEINYEDRHGAAVETTAAVTNFTRRVPKKPFGPNERSQTMFDLPLEYALIKFEDAKPTGKIVPELLDLAARGIVRFIDIVFIHKEEDGNVRTVELNDLDPEGYEMFVPMGEHVSSLFTNEDLQIAASKLPENSAAMLLLWENLWVANIRQALLDAGGELVERAQIAPEVIEQFEQELAAEQQTETAGENE
jgi:hypothetical protein